MILYYITLYIMLYFITYYTLDNASRIGRDFGCDLRCAWSWPHRCWDLESPVGSSRISGRLANMAAMSMENHQVLLKKLNTS